MLVSPGCESQKKQTKFYKVVWKYHSGSVFIFMYAFNNPGAASFRNWSELALLISLLLQEVVHFPGIAVYCRSKVKQEDISSRSAGVAERTPGSKPSISLLVLEALISLGALLLELASFEVSLLACGLALLSPHQVLFMALASQALPQLVGSAESSCLTGSKQSKDPAVFSSLLVEIFHQLASF